MEHLWYTMFKCIDIHVCISEEKIPSDRKSQIDPVQYCEHIQSEVKKARQRVAAKHVNQASTLSSDRLAKLIVHLVQTDLLN